MTGTAMNAADSSTAFLGVDLGGTKAQFVALDAAGRERLRLRYACREFGGFDAMFDRFLEELRSFVGDAAPARAACIGMAGPVRGRRGTLTNLPWTLDADLIARRTAIEHVVLVNDFHAAASGIARLDDTAVRMLQPGVPVVGGNRAIVGAGTGLGVAALVPRDGDWQVLAGEGGHVGFSPADELELGLWQWLRRGGRRVFAERVLSGAGLAAIYEFVCERSGRPAAHLLSAADPAAAIAVAALDGAGADPDAAAALDLFAAAYGGFAGDIALLSLPRGGLFVAGGIAPKVLDEPRASRFVRAFRDKGVHAGLLTEIPVRLVLEPALGAIGAAAIAAAQCGHAAGRLA